MASRRALLVLLASVAAAPGAGAQSVTLAGQMGQRKALLVIDGRTVTLAVGEERDGVRLLALGDGTARVAWGGQTVLLAVGASPVAVEAAARPSGGRRIVLPIGPGGHVLASGAINGRPVRFMVDTGATAVGLGRDEAERLGIDYRGGRQIRMQTANGEVPGWLITLSAVQLGEVALANVAAVVTPASMPHVLLGNSFLARFRLTREHDRMLLELR